MDSFDFSFLRSFRAFLKVFWVRKVIRITIITTMAKGGSILFIRMPKVVANRITGRAIIVNSKSMRVLQGIVGCLLPTE